MQCIARCLSNNRRCANAVHSDSATMCARHDVEHTKSEIALAREQQIQAERSIAKHQATIDRKRKLHMRIGNDLNRLHARLRRLVPPSEPLGTEQRLCPTCVLTRYRHDCAECQGTARVTVAAQTVDGVRVEPGTTLVIGCQEASVCDHCGKPERFCVLCPDCERSCCTVCGRVECLCANAAPQEASA
jgi:hypothetical protein